MNKMRVSPGLICEVYMNKMRVSPGLICEVYMNKMRVSPLWNDPKYLNQSYKILPLLDGDFCPKQSPKCRPELSDGSRSLGLFRKRNIPSYSMPEYTQNRV